MPRPADGELSGELLARAQVIPNGYGITDIDELFAPIEGERDGGNNGVAINGHRIVHMDRLFLEAPNEVARRAKEAINGNGSKPEEVLARTDIIASGVGITAIDGLFEPVERVTRLTHRDELFEEVEPAPVEAIEPDPLIDEEGQAEAAQTRGYTGRVIEFLHRNLAPPEESFGPVVEA